ncbi:MULTISPECIES: RimK family alpha-L-glutamate ligase [Halorussus]|uniref:ATP-grasp domain-containing protein n=1 Tax=Halorussus TaxID=1070314 RepID=UPI000E21171B|nr:MULTISPECIES: hypothetical protein [Halorussus]NHN60993.1 hypothetical protein [Halorussus sp. JP-T4]
MTDSPRTRVGIVTGESAPRLTENGRALRSELRRRGFAAVPVVWTDDEVDWADLDVALLRSCWDYHEAPDAFRARLDALVDAGATVLNPPEVVRWNSHKFYLRDLADAGVPVLPTAWVEASSDADLPALLRDRGWERAVVKPAVGAKARGAFRTSLAEAPDRRDRFASLVGDGDVLVQEFAPEIADGERSLVFFGGEFSHALRRYPAADDFRAHHDYGGTSEPDDPPGDVVEDSRAVLETAGELLGVDPARLPYARVDSIERDGGFRLMELELIEPYLSLDTEPGAVAALADAVETALAAVGAGE